MEIERKVLELAFLVECVNLIIPIASMDTCFYVTTDPGRLS
jgi:hypothetical protein